MTKKVIYVAGPMQGYPDFNFPTFAKVTDWLRSQGHKVFSPAERDLELHGPGISDSPTGSLKDIEHKGFSLRRALADDTAFICNEANTIVMLPGWENSKGAQAEWALSRALGHEIWYLKGTEYA